MYATAIAVLVEKYLLADLLDVADFETLASALILRFDASTRTCRSLDRIIEQFSHKKRYFSQLPFFFDDFLQCATCCGSVYVQ